jgi:hypothetical protein
MFTRQSSQLVDHRAGRLLPVIMSAVVILTIVAVVLATRPFAAGTTPSVKTSASEQYDSPALRQGIGPVSISSEQLDSPALRKAIGPAAGAAIIQSTDALRKEHVPGSIGTTVKPVVTSSDLMRAYYLQNMQASLLHQAWLREVAAAYTPVAATADTMDALRREHLAPFVASVRPLPGVTGRDRVEIHRLEHLKKAPTFDTWGGGQ